MLNQFVKFCLQAATALGVCIVANSAFAGEVKVNADSAGLVWDANKDGKANSDDKVGGILNDASDGNLDNRVTFNLGTPEKEAEIGTVWIWKYVGDSFYPATQVKLDKGGNTLASLEPFSFPLFSATTPIVVTIEMADLKSASTVFAVGKSFSVIDGLLAESAAITFKDASSLANVPDFSGGLVALLPNYTGSVVMQTIGNAAPIPEPDIFAMLLVGLGVLRLSKYGRPQLRL